MTAHRYTDKDNAFLKVHKSSAPYNEFQAAVKDSGIEIVTKTGQSYIEEDIGYM